MAKRNQSSYFCYKISRKFLIEEKYGLVSQIKKAAVSIPSNIEERSSRFSEKDNDRFLEIALGSAFELETQLIIIERLEIVNSTELVNLIDEIKAIQKILTGLMQKLNRS